MAATELRVWRTTESLKFPYYKIPYTRAQLLGAKGPDTFNDNRLYIYDNFTSGVLLKNYISEFRWIARKSFQGWNAIAALSFEPAGAFRWQTTSGPSTMSHSHSPGTAIWEDGGSYERLTAGGARLPGFAGIGVAQFRPFPNEYFGWKNADNTLLNRVILHTLDNKLMDVSFAPNINAFGWMNWGLFDLSDANMDNFPADPSTMLSELIETSEDGDDDVAVRFNPRTATSTVGCYVADNDGVREWLNDLWSSNLVDTIRKAFIGDGSNALLGIRWFYGIREQLETGASAYVSLGNVAFKSTRKFPVAMKEFVEYDMGSVVVQQYFGDQRDWTASSYQMYLPFIGKIDLDPKDVIGKTIYLKYWINISDGSAVCIVSNTPSTPDGTGTIFTGSCSWGYDIPVRVDSSQDLAARLGRVVLGMTSLSDTAGASQYSAGELSPNSNVMGDFQAKLIVHRRTDLSGADYEAVAGLPGAAPATVGSMSGYVKASTVYNAGTLTMRRAGEIVALLQEGIYV